MSSVVLAAKIIIFAILATTTNILGSCYEIQNVTAPTQTGKIGYPHWSLQENALYWTESFGQRLFRMDGVTGEITTRDVCYGPVFLIVPVQDFPGYIVVAVRSSLYLLKWGAPGGDLALRQLTTVEAGKPDNNINEGKTDAAGRLCFGTIGKVHFKHSRFVSADQATLYSMDSRNYFQPDIKKQPVSISFGIAWSLDNKKMYYNDSPARKIVAFDYDLETGRIADEITIFRFDDFNLTEIPGGMTKDTEGNLWVASFGGVILNIDPISGTLIRQIELPVDQVSSVVWGGCCLDILYATTSTFKEVDRKPLSGCLFAITNLGTKGVPENQFVFPGASTY